MVEQGQGTLLRKPAHLPQSLAAIEPARGKGVGPRELLDACTSNSTPPPQVAHVAIPPPFGEVGLGSKPGGGVFFEAVLTPPPQGPPPPHPPPFWGGRLAKKAGWGAFLRSSPHHPTRLGLRPRHPPHQGEGWSLWLEAEQTNEDGARLGGRRAPRRNAAPQLRAIHRSGE